MTDIHNPFNAGFAFVACQLGASEQQVAELYANNDQEHTHASRAIYHDNRKLGALLAFPYHDRRGVAAMTMPKLYDLFAKWNAQEGALALRRQSSMSLHEFRKLIDPWLHHDKGGESSPSASKEHSVKESLEPSHEGGIHS